MADYKNRIVEHANEVNRLHSAIHETFEHRDKSPKHREEWKLACLQYRNHHTSIDDWIIDINRSEIFDWEDAREFTFQYLTVDPVYNNSGYTKQMLIKKLKKCEFTDVEAQVLRALIIKRIRSGGQGHLKMVCGLIPKIQNMAFNQEVLVLANAKDESVSLRGKIALRRLIDT